MTTVLELSTVSRIHGSGHTAVRALIDVSLVADAGELVAVMGPSGSGKTTLLSLAGGLDHPTSGHVLVEGRELGGLSVAELARVRRRRIGYVFQQLNLIDGLTAAENVSLPLELDGVDRRRATALAVEALQRVSMDELADRFPEELSGGEQQRVAIARAVVGDRVLLLADEPTGALDSITGEAVLRLMRRHCDDGGCGILVTHDARFAAWADRVVFLRDGRVIDETTPSSGPEALLSEPVSS
ncbi:MAG TPA: ABC transporter ATP-binding protein [Actinomycetota bacterium]|nr:ABC transporter ATP-binding protein [Actinomycetota bacterium]